MAPGNGSSVTYFILLGLTQQPELQLPLFFVFSGIYMMTMLGNMGLLVLIGFSSHLRNPMYFFLFNLSLIDLCYASVTTPRMLVSFITENIIPYAECMAQLFFFCFFIIGECYLLTAMAYDRYVAICKPLLYRVTMSPAVCLALLLAAYMMGILGATTHTVCMLRVNFCDSNIVNHYMCDIYPLLRLSCSSIHLNELAVFIIVGINVVVPTFTISLSYTLIISSILRISSKEGRSKAFSTCSSHIITVCLFIGSAAFMYLKPSVAGSPDQEKISTVFYNFMGPMMNPFIYSFRNKDVQIALSKILKRKVFS